MYLKTSTNFVNVYPFSTVGYYTEKDISSEHLKGAILSKNLLMPDTKTEIKSLVSLFWPGYFMYKS